MHILDPRVFVGNLRAPAFDANREGCAFAFLALGCQLAAVMLQCMTRNRESEPQPTADPRMRPRASTGMPMPLSSTWMRQPPVRVASSAQDADSSTMDSGLSRSAYLTALLTRLSSAS